MKQVIGHFTVYDFMGYIFPGAIFFSVIFFLFEPIITIVPSFDAVGLIIGAAVFLGISYILGHAIQAIAIIVNRKIIYKFVKYPSKVLLDEDNEFYVPEFREKLKKMIWSTFELPLETPQQKAFDLSYTFVLQKGLTRRVERFLDLFAFYRGISLAFFFSAIVLIVSVVIHFENVILISGSIVIFVTLGVLFLHRQLAFGVRFADAVYREFYVYQIDKN